MVVPNEQIVDPCHSLLFLLAVVVVAKIRRVLLYANTGIMRAQGDGEEEG